MNNKAKSHTLINDVTDTAAWVAFYRAKESLRTDRLFNDQFAARLSGERGKRIAEDMKETSRYTEWAVVFRTLVIDQFILSLIGEGLDAVVNLGAGLDSRPYRMNLPPNFDWVEVDYPKMIQFKLKVLGGETAKCRLTSIEADLSDDLVRKKVLSEVVPEAKKVLILTEGVLPYLSQEQVSKLARDLYDNDRFKFWVGEYFSPLVYRYLQKRSFSKKMRNAPFLFFPKDYLGFFANEGWKPREIKYYGNVADKYGRKVPMPLWAKLLLKIAPAKAREESGRHAGYMLLERAQLNNS